MQEVKRRRRITAILLLSVFYLSACTHPGFRALQKPQGPEVSSEARELLFVLEKQNNNLRTFKGTGRITLQKSGAKDAAVRIAWIGALPDRLRIMLRNVSGQPLVSVAGDGHWVYFFSHTQGKYSKQRSASTFLQRFFSDSITFEDVVRLLAGRVWVAEYGQAVVQTDESGSGYILVLKTAWGNIAEKIYFTANKRTVRKFEMFDQNGDVIYRVEFDGEQIINGYRIPGRLIFLDRHKSGFKLEIDRYWADVSVTPDTFVLAPPE